MTGSQGNLECCVQIVHCKILESVIHLVTLLISVFHGTIF